MKLIEMSCKIATLSLLPIRDALIEREPSAEFRASSDASGCFTARWSGVDDPMPDALMNALAVIRAVYVLYFQAAIRSHAEESCKLARGSRRFV